MVMLSRVFGLRVSGREGFRVSVLGFRWFLRTWRGLVRLDTITLNPPKLEILNYDSTTLKHQDAQSLSTKSLNFPQAS